MIRLTNLRCIFFWIGLLWMLPSLNLSAQVSHSDTSNVKIILPQEKWIQEYKSNKAYQYQELDEKPLANWFLDFLRWLGKGYRKVSSSGSTLKYIYWAGIFILLFGIVFLFVRSDKQFLFFKKKKILDLNIKVLNENIHDINFEQIIDAELQKNNFRMATRYLFLKLLKILDTKKQITWDIDKTNTNYLSEINNSDIKQKFAYLSNLYEMVWYGEIFIQKIAYQKIADEFTYIYSNIQKSE